MLVAVGCRVLVGVDEGRFLGAAEVGLGVDVGTKETFLVEVGALVGFFVGAV